MAVREAVFNIYSDAGGNMPKDRAGFNDNVFIHKSSCEGIKYEKISIYTKNLFD